MLGENHSLSKDFVDHLPVIEHLRATNKTFAHLADKYDKVDKEIYRIEMGELPATDDYLERCKFERLHLKDTLFSMIRAAEAGM